MSALLFLSSGDFSVQKGVSGDILCHGIQGYSLILFYSTHCVHCQTLIPIFKSLPGTIMGCQFGMINVSTNKECVMMSKKTIAPIQYVPYIVFYINGRPYMAYKGPNTIEDIQNFVKDVANKLNSKQQFSRDVVKQQTPSSIPQYTIGIPICGNDKVCYLTDEEVYRK